MEHPPDINPSRIDWKALGAALKASRTKRVPRLSQPMLAEKLEIPQSSISFAEKGLEGRVSWARVQSIAEELEVDWKQYLAKEQDPGVHIENWSCQETCCPGARPFVFDCQEGYEVRFKSYRFKSHSHICPLCGSESGPTDDPDAPVYLIGDVPYGYTQILNAHPENGSLEELVERIQKHWSTLMSQNHLADQQLSQPPSDKT